MKLLVFNAILFVIVSFSDSLFCCFYICLVLLTKKLRYSGTPLIRPPMGKKNWAVLRVDRINEVCFTKKCMVDFPDGPEKGPLGRVPL